MHHQNQPFPEATTTPPPQQHKHTSTHLRVRRLPRRPQLPLQLRQPAVAAVQAGLQRVALGVQGAERLVELAGLGSLR
jgi:hypothetical protein